MQKQKEYQNLVEQVSPNSPLLKNCIVAFFSGGTICTIGEVLTNFFLNMGISKDETTFIVMFLLILTSAILTGLGIYGKIGKYCGAGTAVPITGFANSVTSPAIEYKNAGLILGMAAKMFVLAGPVIVYGVLTSIGVGTIYYFLK